MNIGKASELSELSAKTIRYYEEIGLVTPQRAENGYRDYHQDDVHRLAFVQRSRSLGFSVEECRSLLSLYDDDNRASANVKELALRKLEQVDQKIFELQSLRNTLNRLAENCQGNNKPDCPIMDDLAGKR